MLFNHQTSRHLKVDWTNTGRNMKENTTLEVPTAPLLTKGQNMKKPLKKKELLKSRKYRLTPASEMLSYKILQEVLKGQEVQWQFSEEETQVQQVQENFHLVTSLDFLGIIYLR